MDGEQRQPRATGQSVRMVHVRAPSESCISAVFRVETLGIPTDVSRNDYIDRITGMGSV